MLLTVRQVVSVRAHGDLGRSPVARQYGAAFSLAGRLISVCGQPDGFPPAWFSPGPEGIRTRPCGFERRPNLHLAASDRAASPKLSDHGRLQVPARRPTSGARQPAQVSLHKYIVAQPLCMV
jgi:hypothetical protein